MIRADCEQKFGGCGHRYRLSTGSGTQSLSQSMELVPEVSQLAVAALLKEATASSVLSNTSNTVASFVMYNTSIG